VLTIVCMLALCFPWQKIPCAYGFSAVHGGKTLRRQARRAGQMGKVRLLSGRDRHETALGKSVTSFVHNFFKKGGARTEYMRHVGADTSDERYKLSLVTNLLKNSDTRVVDKIRVLSFASERHEAFQEHALYKIDSADDGGPLSLLGVVHGKSGNFYDVAYMPAVLSNLDDHGQRVEAIKKVRGVLRKPGFGGHPHRCGLLIIVENTTVYEDTTSVHIDAQVSSQSDVYTSWRDAICNEGFRELKTWTIRSTNISTWYRLSAFVPDTAPGQSGTNALMWSLQDMSAAQVAGGKNDFHVAIVGGGLGGTALALELKKRCVPFTVFEKDSSFDCRKQGYALTIQQAHSALRQCGIDMESLFKASVSSKSHISLNSVGEVLGHYSGAQQTTQKHLSLEERMSIYDSYADEFTGIVCVRSRGGESSRSGHVDIRRRHNIHIPRQLLREMLFKSDDLESSFRWNQRIVDVEQVDGSDKVCLVLNSGERCETSVVVGADGIFSGVRRALENLSVNLQTQKPLQYLGLIVILGISPSWLFTATRKGNSGDGSPRTIQWVDGNARAFTMPYDHFNTMWQVSFPIGEEEAMKLTNIGPALKELTLERLAEWDHALIEAIQYTDPGLVSGHPVYDRDPIQCSDFLGTLRGKESLITLLGDAAHPMSPFKGQGANQALLDAAALSKLLHSSMLGSQRRGAFGARSVAESLRLFEREMCARTESVVIKSRQAAVFLHNEEALTPGDVSRANAAAYGLLNDEADD
jgi:salicylate hydroxylase